MLVDKENVSDSQLREYSTRHHQFLTPLPTILERLIERSPHINSVADVGCGDGVFLFALRSKLPNGCLTGVDLSPERLANLRTRDLHVQTVVADACNLTPLKGQFFDLVVSSQVIEHVPSDTKMLEELSSVTRSGSYVFLSTVVKHWYGWWIYRCNGKVTCDPTHVREYRSKEEFCELVENGGFKVLECSLTPFCPSVLNFLMQILVRWRLVRYETIDKFIQRYPRLIGWLRGCLRVWAPGYFNIEVLALKIKEPG